MVFGTPYKVVTGSNLLPDTDIGLCDPETKTIYIDSSLEDDDLKVTLTHELLHAAGAEVGFENLGIDPKMWEVIIDVHSKVIVKNFRITNKK